MQLLYMQARYYDPVIGRFYSNDPAGFTGEVDTFNRYSYVANNPYKYTDPNGEAKIYIWSKGQTATPGDPSFFGHISIWTTAADGNSNYISKHPTSRSPFSSSADFRTFEQDMATYGRLPKVIDLPLPSEEGADKFAKGLKKDPNQTWSATNTCADAVESVIEAGGGQLPGNDPINTPSAVHSEVQAVKSSGGFSRPPTGSHISRKKE